VTCTKFHDARVSAGTVRETWCDLVEQAFDDLIIAKPGDRQPARIELIGIRAVCTVTRKRDQAFGIAANGSGLGLGGLNTLVRKELFDQVAP